MAKLKLPDAKKRKPETIPISLRVELPLANAFERLKRTSKRDVAECQRVVLRDLAERLDREVKR